MRAFYVLLILVLVILTYYWAASKQESLVAVSDYYIPCRKNLGGSIIAYGFYNPIADQCSLYDPYGAEYIDTTPYLEVSYADLWYPIDTYRSRFRYTYPGYYGWGQATIGPRPWVGAVRTGPRPRTPIGGVPHFGGSMPHPSGGMHFGGGSHMGGGSHGGHH